MNFQKNVGLLTSTPKKDTGILIDGKSSNYSDAGTVYEPSFSSIEQDYEETLSTASAKTEENLNFAKSKEIISNPGNPVSFCNSVHIQEENLSRTLKNSPVPVINSFGLEEFPVSPDLKNKVRQRLYSLVNDIDGYVPSKEESNHFIQCMTTDTKFVNNSPSLKEYQAKNNQNIDINYNNNNGSRLNLLQKLLKEKVSNEVISISSEEKVLKESFKKQLFIDDDGIEVKTDNSYKKKSSNTNAYKQTIEESSKVIESLKNQIETLESRLISKNSSSCSCNGSKTSLSKSAAQNGIQTDELSINYQNSLFLITRNIMLKNEALEKENDILKINMKRLEENSKCQEEKQKQLEQTYGTLLQKEKQYQREALENISRDLVEKEKHIRELRQALIETKTKYEKYIEIKDQEKNSLFEKLSKKSRSQSCGNVTEEEPRKSPLEIEKYYKRKLLQQQEFAKAQIAEYKKAIRVLKEDRSKV